MSSRTRNWPRADHRFVLIWALLISVVLFGAYVAQDQSLIAMMLAADRSYLSIFIILVFVGATCHAAWHILSVSGRLRGAETLLAGHAKAAPDTTAIRRSRFLEEFLDEIGGVVGGDPERADPQSPSGDRDNILEIYADQLRSPVEIGWFVVDILIRLGLVGTIIGFILILQSLTEGPAPQGDDIRTLLVSMSGGMGTALYTTLAGLVSATLLGVQYMILSRCVEHLIGALVRIGQRRAGLPA